MKEWHCTADTSIYREGDASDRVYIVREGEVEVTRDIHGSPTVLAVFRRGQIFGEMGVIRDQPRSTSTRALTDTTLVVIDRAQFLGAFNTESPIVLPVLRMLCERLSAADEQVLEHLHTEGVSVDEVKRVRLLPDDHHVETQIGADGVVIEAMPYLVGRRLEADERPLKTPANLALVAHDAHHLSPQHFVIDDAAGRLVVRDAGSYLGTEVNGNRIASFEHSSVAGLHFGDNPVVAGGADSPYRFHVVVEKAENGAEPDASQDDG